MRFPHYKQLEQKDCGATCLKIIAKYYGKHVDLQYLRDLTGASREGASLMDMSSAAEKIGLRAMVVAITQEQLVSKIPLPCIVHWNQNHFLVVYKISKNKIWVSDPGRQKMSYSYSDFRQKWLGSVGRKTGHVIALEPQPFFKKVKVAGSTDRETSNLTSFHIILKYLHRYRKQLLQIAFVMLLITVLQAIVPFIFRAILDIGVGKQDVDFINIMLIAHVILIVSIALANFIRDWIVKHVGARFSIALISDYLIKLLKMPLSYFENKMSGDILNRVKDQERIKDFILNHLINAIFATISFSVLSLVLLSFNSWLFFIFLIGTTIYIGWVMFFMKFQEKLDWDYYSLTSQNQSYWIEVISGITEIKSNNYEQKKRWKWEQLQASLYHQGQKSMQINNFQNVGSQMINGLKNVSLTFFSAKAVLNGDMTIGMMISVQFILGFLNAPILHFISFIQAFTPAKISFLRLNEIHNLDDDETYQQPYDFNLPENRDISLKNVFFRYAHSDPFSLKNISLNIPAGKVTALVGMSGSGKTTLLKLLLRLYMPTDGDIRIGDTKIGNINLRKWRSVCASVLQDGKIFNDTILNNIVLNDEKMDYDRVAYSVELAQLKDVIEGLPLGYHTRIGEKGRGLSQGQKQRILIARALYRDPEYLFLDEATNALDAISEQRILNNLDNIFQNRTVVVAAHRLSTIQKADQIIVLNKGLIVSAGTHDELISQRGFYFKLFDSQLQHQEQFVKEDKILSSNV